MKIKKADLRKGLAQLPINYPAPTVEDVFDYESEKHRVENLCKKLSHNEVEVRDAVLAELPRYLKEVSEAYHTTEAGVTAPKRADVELLLQKLCLGIFYCYWHSDKPLVQHECAFKISQLLFAPLSGEMQLLFAQSFFFILSQQWGKIDHYRMDKYLAMVRKIVYQLMALCKLHHEKFLKERSANGESPKATPRAAATEVCTPANANIAPFVVQLCTFLQDKVVCAPSSVGLTMHLMDIFLDELIRSDVPVDLFVYLSEQIPLFVMSKGNFVEKRVLDNFVTPIVSGVLDERRVLTLSSSPDEEKRKATEKKKAAAKRRGAEEEATERDYSAENDTICIQLANVCRDFSVRRGTKFFVRSMFVESQKLLLRRLEVKLNPSDFKRLTKRDMQARLADEIREQEEAADKTMKFRKLIKDDFKKDKLDAKKILKKQMKRQRDDEDEAEDAVDAEEPQEKPKRTKKRTEKDTKETTVLSKKEKRALKKVKPSAAKEKIAAPTPKKVTKKAPVVAEDANLRPGVKRQLEKMQKKAALMDARRKKLDAGERESKVSVKGIKQSSKRSKYVKMTTRDILAEAARAEAEDAGPAPSRF